MRTVTVTCFVIVLVASSFAWPYPDFQEIAIADNEWENTILSSANVVEYERAANFFTGKITKSIKKYTSKVVSRVVDYVKEKLADVEEKAHKLIAASEDKLAKVQHKVDKTIEKVQTDLDEWSERRMKQAENADDDTKEQIQTILDTFTDAITAEARECGDSIVEPIKNLHEETKTTVENSFPIIEDLVAKIEECASVDQKLSKLTTKCATELKDKAKALLPLPGKYAVLLRKLSLVAVDSLKNSPCVARVYGQMERQKKEIKQQIQELLKQ